MMWIVIILPLILTFLQGTGGIELKSCGLEKCAEDIDLDPFQGREILPDAKQLTTMCPNILNAMKCVSDTILDCSGMTIQALALSKNESISSVANLALDVERVLKDLCNEESDLHKGYVESVDCVKEFITHTSPRKCHDETDKIFDTYMELLTAKPEEPDFPVEQRMECLYEAYLFACKIGMIKDACGEVASNTVSQILKELKYFRSGNRFDLCSEEDVEYLKTEFLDLLKLEEEHNSLFAKIFDLSSI